MSNQENTPITSFSDLEARLKNAENTGAHTSHEQSSKTKDSKELAKIKWRTRNALAWTAVGLVGVIVVGGVAKAKAYWDGAASAFAFKSETTGEILDSGKGTVVSANADMQPIIIGEMETFVGGVKPSIEQKEDTPFVNPFNGEDIKIPLGTDSITQAALVTSQFTVDPEKITVEYDPNDTEKSEFGQLTYYVDGAVSTDVSIESGHRWTTEPKQSLKTGFFDNITDPAKTLDGTFGTGFSDIGVIKDAIQYKQSTYELMVNYAEAYIMTEVDKQCTPKALDQIEEYKDELINNITDAVEKQVDNPKIPNDVSKAMAELKSGNVTELKNNAEVEINFSNVGPDEEAIADRERLSKMFTTVVESDTPMECGVEDGVELARATEENE